MSEHAMIEAREAKKVFYCKKSLFGKKKAFCAVNNVSFSVRKGEIVGIVGESGSGKTTFARAILGLTKLSGGEIFIDGVNMAQLRGRKLKELRGKIAVVFQDPASNLNPKETVGSSIMRPMRIRGISRSQAFEKAITALKKVKLDASYMDSYPHQLSGGQLQRIALARALVLEPKIMILDEPTSALDISIQAQVLNLLLELQEDLNLTYLVITHDINVIRYICDRVAVMHTGKIVEEGPCSAVLSSPRDPYTRQLLSAVPPTHPKERKRESGTL